MTRFLFYLNMELLALIFFYLALLDCALMLCASWWWFCDLFSHFTPQFVAGSVVLALYFLYSQDYVYVVMLVAAIAYFGRPLFLLWARGSHDQIGSDAIEITVLHINVNTHNERYDDLIALIEKYQPTIVAMNEVRQEWIDRITHRDSNPYIYNVTLPDHSYRGMAVLSRIPYDSYDIHTATVESAPILEVRFKDPKMTVFAVHTLPSLGAKWARQCETMIRFLGDQIAGTIGPVILTGDFNSTIFSPTFRSMMKRAQLHDVRQGYGLKPSWMRYSIFALAIDHIVYRKAIAREFAVLDTIGSDHWPLFARFVIQ